MYPIQIVAKQTGLTPATLRAWEKRYAGIMPDRKENGRRLYTEELLTKLKLLARLVREGYRIGDIAYLQIEELSRLERELSTAPPLSHGSDLEEELNAASAAVLRMDLPELNRLLEVAASSRGQLELADKVVFPLISRVESQESALPVHRSLLYTSLLSFLHGQLPPLQDVPEERMIAVAVPRGSEGMVGAVASMVHVVASGWYPLLLGEDLVAADIAMALLDSRAKALLLSIVTEELHRELRGELGSVSERLVWSIPLLFGGKMPDSAIKEIESLGFRYVHSMSSLRKELLTTVV